ncbi:MAG: hypothetical protein P4L53_08780 [Candidatus Obscuribacterales bacterium]|nr:hypothetical protein [Candidatus Obscuribacterales bacterium]
MRALEKIMWKALKAQQSHLKSCDKLEDWEIAESQRVDGEDPISASCYTASVVFLMKHARRSQKRLELFKFLVVQCRMFQEDCSKKIDTPSLTKKQRKKLKAQLREAESHQKFVESWVENEQDYFGHLDEYLSDVFECFTALYTRTDPTADIEPNCIDESGEVFFPPTILTRH